MAEYKFKQVDFNKPSFLFKLEDTLKGFLGRFMYKPYIESFDLKGDEHVLDFGCGGGVESRYIVEQLQGNGHLTCADISKYFMERAQKRLKKYRNVVFMLGDIRELSIPECSFDVICTIHVIHDIAPDERQDIVNALSRKIKPGGIFYIWEPIKVSHGMPVAEVRELLSKAGFQESAYETTKLTYKGKFLKENNS
jgi:ubiquinone/menaquinone biosynthesis C-methylase UbiE